MKYLILLLLLGCSTVPVEDQKPRFPCAELIGEERDDCILRERENRRRVEERSFIMGRPSR
jgi:hypothetical protein